MNFKRKIVEKMKHMESAFVCKTDFKLKPKHKLIDFQTESDWNEMEVSLKVIIEHWTLIYFETHKIQRKRKGRM